VAGTDVVRSDATSARERSYEELERIFAGVDAPFALVDLDALWSNARGLLSRASGTPIRVASKSVRCRSLLATILETPGFEGLMTFTLPESLWLHGHGFDDLLLAYPSADRAALAELARLDGEGSPILMVDSVEHLDYIEAATKAESGRPIRVCLELDTSWWPLGGRLKVGAKRSPVRTPQQAQALAREIVSRPTLELAALMGYEAHIAGVGDRPLDKRLQGPLIRAMKRRSVAELAERRAAVVAAVREVAPVPIVNGGGTGSVAATAAEDAVTEVTAGSGFYDSVLFDHYRSLDLRPAAAFAMPVVRKPGPRIATVLGGGYLASGAPGKDRLPEPYLPRRLRLDSFEGAGEVQTPVLGEPAARLGVGDRVYFRHAKAGELCERFDSLHLVEDGRIVDQVPTYRGEGKCFL
jgi:D-serine deaminase-like pyridoxal phosphate-dependent protein